MIWYIIKSVADRICGHVDIFWLFAYLAKSLLTAS